jgi:hypothetical protein
MCLIIIVTLVSAVVIHAQYFPSIQSYGTVYSRNGTAIEGIHFYPLSNIDYTNALNSLINSYPSVTIVDYPTSEYNCYSYAFHLSEGNTTKVWIDPLTTLSTANLSNYWTDGSFVQVCDEADADKAVYYNGDHAAVTHSSISGYYESKWGANCRVLHTPTDVPYNDPTSRNYYASTRISGDTKSFCSGTRTFNVKNITGATYSWSVSSGLTVIGSDTSSTVTVQASGTAVPRWIQVSISTPCSAGSAVSTLSFGYDVPVINLFPYETFLPSESVNSLTYNNVCALATANIYLDVPDANAVTWSKYTTPLNVNWTQYGNDLNFYFFAASQTATFQVTATNSCGSSTEYFAFNSTDCSGDDDPCDSETFSVSPNPASNNIVVIINSPPPCDELSYSNNIVYNMSTGKTKLTDISNSKKTKNLTSLKIGIQSILIHDVLGKLYKTLKYSDAKQATVSVGDLPNGIYIMSITGRKKTIQHKIIVRH